MTNCFFWTNYPIVLYELSFLNESSEFSKASKFTQIEFCSNASKKFWSFQSSLLDEDPEWIPEVLVGVIIS